MGAAAFDAFCRAHYNLVLRFIERRIDRDVAADLCAQCFEIAWRKFDEDAPFELPWLYQTARNLVGNAYRKRDRQHRLVERLADEHPEVSDDAVQAEVRAALWRLPRLDREALQLTYWEGLSAAEVGAVLACSEQAAWKRISRAKAKLREQLGPTVSRKEAEDAKR